MNKIKKKLEVLQNGIVPVFFCCVTHKLFVYKNLNNLNVARWLSFHFVERGKIQITIVCSFFTIL